MRKILLLAFIVIVSACGTVKLLTPTQADADRGTQKFTGYTLADLNQGKTLFEQDCAKCHRLKRPESRNEEQWNKIVPKMVKKANKEAGTEKINQADQDLILHYLITMNAAKPTN
jgi:cytochrome c2